MLAWFSSSLELAWDKQICTEFLSMKIFQISSRLRRMKYWNMHLSDPVLLLGPLISLGLSIILDLSSQILDKEETGLSSSDLLLVEKFPLSWVAEILCWQIDLSQVAVPWQHLSSKVTLFLNPKVFFDHGCGNLPWVISWEGGPQNFQF